MVVQKFPFNYLNLEKNELESKNVRKDDFSKE